MAHQVETMAYAGEVPWHGLGVPVSNDLTPTQMMEKAGVDWRVDEVECFIKTRNGDVPTGQKALVRSTDDRILTTVGENWNPVQNADAFDFFAEYVNAGDMEMHTAGSLKDGQIVWALAKVKDSFELFDGDRVDSYLLFSNPHQYGKSIDIRFTPIRVVCNNTLTFALDSMSDRQVKVGHRSIFDASMVKQTLGIATDTMQKYKEVAAFLGSKRFTQDTYIEYLNSVFPRTSDKRIKSGMDKIEQMSRNAKLCYDALEQQPGAEYAEGSWWQAFNSVTFITDHVQGRNQENRLANSWFGYNQTRKREALKSAIEFAEAA
jgi:phage/plasmid-like protein (TIGR03299 family)